MSRAKGILVRGRAKNLLSEPKRIAGFSVDQEHKSA